MNNFMISAMKNSFDRTRVSTLAFRAVTRCDAFPLFEATRNAEFNRFLLWAAPEGENGVVGQVDKIIRECALDRAVAISLVERTTGTWVGMARIQGHCDGIELGLMLHPNSWATGVIPSAGRVIIDTMLAHIGELPLYIRVRPGNIRMEKICAFYHFEVEAQVTDKHAQDGEVPLQLFRLRKDLWQHNEAAMVY